MNRFVDLSGREFGIWRVIEQAPRRDNKTRWLCECAVCGQRRSKRSTVLRVSLYGKCDGRHNARVPAPSPLRKAEGYAAGTETYGHYRRTARQRGLSFSLSRNDFDTLTQQVCHYCGRPPSQRHTRRHFNGAFVYNGIDRKDSLVGYEVSNCLPCCGTCNVMKQNGAIVDEKQTFGFFPTPPDVADRVVELADIQSGQRVLEPSAGTGNLLRAMYELPFERLPLGGDVVIVELAEGRCLPLKNEFPCAQVRKADFLECNGDLGTFERIIMNPPFKEDIKHIKHARKFLKPGGRLVAICANGPRQQEKLKPLASQWIDLPAGSFSEQGTKVNAAIVVIDG